ncbi:MAG: heme exporter protein CcmD [Alphaproteobacteria bacterium]|nr:heme exporter protein CcmD [Alphaproteobacteria bacterium]
MLDLGKHAIFIWSSYAVVAVVISGLALWLVAEGVRLRRRLGELDEQGVRRRSRRD